MRKRKYWVLAFVFLICFFYYQVWSAYKAGPNDINEDNLHIKIKNIRNYPKQRINMNDTPDQTVQGVHSYFQGIKAIGATPKQKERKEKINAACQRNVSRYRNPLSGYDLRQYIFSDERHGLIYCQVQKAGSSFMWNMMVKLNQSTFNVDKTLPGLYSYPYKMPSAQFHALLMNSFKIMFVREPYGRIFAAYVDKLLSANLFYWNYYGKVIKKELARYFKKPQKKECGHDVSFTELIVHVVKSERIVLMRDSHFTPMYDHCSPCQVKYDYIGKLETFKDDAMAIFQSWNKVYGTNIHFGDFSKESDLDSVKYQLIRLFETRKSWNNCITFHSALKREWRTLQIRGMIPINIALPFSEQEASKLSWKQMYESIVTIYNKVTDFKTLKRQKKEAMIEAYSQVPREVMEELREIIKPDCELFGYNASPPSLFNKHIHQNRVPKYFDIPLGNY